MSERASYPEVILTTAEVARLLQMSQRHVQWLVKTKRLQAVRIGRSYRVRGRHLQAFLDEHEIIQADA